MAAQIFQVDLAHPLMPVFLNPRWQVVWILVRFGVHPIGWVRWRRATLGAVLTPDMIQGLISENLGMQVMDLLRDPKLRNPPPPRCQPSFSIVICTREHPDLLERQLRSIEKLDYPNFETIVVDNAPKTPRTRCVCEKFPRLVRYILEPRKGLDYARNTGWCAARNEIVAYTDDDACVDRNWLRALADNYADPQVWCVTGDTHAMEIESRAQELFEKYGGMHKGFVRKVYRPGTWNSFYPLGSGRFGAGVNLSLRRSALARMGGFDDGLDVGSLTRGGGDLDIMARCLRDGGCLVYEPRAIVWHQHRRTMAQLRRQMFDYGYGFVAYCAKHSRDLELGNQSTRMLKRWANRWGNKRLRENLRMALKLQPHFPIRLILLEIAGGIMGWKSYQRAQRHVRMVAYDRRLAARREEARRQLLLPAISTKSPRGPSWPPRDRSPRNGNGRSNRGRKKVAA